MLKKAKNLKFLDSNRLIRQDKVCKWLEFQLVRYLRLPSLVGKLEYNTFRIFKEKIWAKTNSWKNNFLSQVGKEILIKAIIQAIPIFFMSVFKLPRMLCKEITLLIPDFGEIIGMVIRECNGEVGQR